MNNGPTGAAGPAGANHHRTFKAVITASTALAIGSAKIAESPPDHSKGDEPPADNATPYIMYLVSMQNYGPTGAIQAYSLSMTANGLPPGNNMAVAVVWAASLEEAKSRTRAEASAYGIEIGYFENGHTVVNEPTGLFAKEMKEAAGKVSRCVIAPFEGNPIRPA